MIGCVFNSYNERKCSIDTKRSILYDYSFPLPIQAAAPYSREVYYLLSKKKNGYIEWLQYTASHHAISKTPGKQKNKLYKGMFGYWGFGTDSLKFSSNLN